MINRTSKILPTILLLSLGFSEVCFAQQKERAEPILPSVKKLMSPEEFAKAGLKKLSEDEIKALDAWVVKHSLEVAKFVTAKTAVEAKEGAIETQIEGEFTGWTGETLWKMTNGQIWQQAAYAYHYRYLYRPKVLIYPMNNGWRMRVGGTDTEVAVKLVR